MNPTFTSAGRSLVVPLIATAAVLVLGGVLLVVDAGRRGCPPDVPRPWAAKAFAERTASGFPEPWPTLAEVGPAPDAATVSADGTEVEMAPEAKSIDSSEAWRLYERTPVAVGETAALPGSGGWTATLTHWRAPGTDWLDPVTGELSGAEIRQWGGPSGIARRVRAHIVFRTASNDGSDVTGKLAVGRPALFDRVTGVQLGEGTSWGLRGDTVQVSLATSLAHRARLMLEIPVCYGDQAPVEIPVRRGAEVVLGSGPTLRIEYVSRGALTGGSIHPDGRYTVLLEAAAPDAPATLAVVSVWPPAWAERVVVASHGPFTGSSLNGSFPLSTVQWWDREPPERLQVRLLPRAARLQFDLPEPMPLPEVENLFELPPPDAADGVYSYYDELEQRLQVSLDGVALPLTSAIPAAATSGQALTQLLAGSDERYDPKLFAATDRELGLLERAADWIRGLLP